MVMMMSKTNDILKFGQAKTAPAGPASEHWSSP